jgi:hypothetical protein
VARPVNGFNTVQDVDKCASIGTLGSCPFRIETGAEHKGHTGIRFYTDSKKSASSLPRKRITDIDNFVCLWTAMSLDLPVLPAECFGAVRTFEGKEVELVTVEAVTMAAEFGDFG